MIWWKGFRNLAAVEIDTLKRLVRGWIELKERVSLMGILSWIVMGLIIGAVAKWIMPGEDPGGIIVTILIGIAGAFVGGFVGSLLGLGSVSGFNIVSLLLALGGALLLLYGYRLIKK